jgi:hypothetical protein
MPLQATSGAASYDAFGGGVSYIPQYIEDVFSTWLYTGTGATQTITNGIDLSTKGGLTWIKSRSAARNHNLFDTAQGATKVQHSNLEDATVTDANSLTAFNTTGFTLGSGNTTGNQVNTSAATYASWSFRKQPKFFDVVTWTGNATNRTISHNLGSVPGCIIVHRTSTSGDWVVYHRSLGNTGVIVLNQTNASFTDSTRWNSTTPTATEFSLGTASSVNGNGSTYVAYIFAHDAGGFGLTGTDNVISCGSYTGNGSATGPVVTLGYEPQWLLVKCTSLANQKWVLLDNMRGLPVGSQEEAVLFANTTGAESAAYSGSTSVSLTPTGFILSGAAAELNSSSATYIYIAIRRGPMKVPTTGTSVFSPVTSSAATGTALSTGFPIDLQINKSRPGFSSFWVDRLRGVNTTTSENSQPFLTSNNSNSEDFNTALTRSWSNSGFLLPSYYNSSSTAYWNFRRAPGFFDEVCYTGNGGTQTLNHNLGVAPELWFIKSRTDSGDSLGNWGVYAASLGLTQWARINSNEPFGALSGAWTGATASTFSIGSPGAFPNDRNRSGQTYVAYLFATCPGVSKVGSYTGNGSSQTINCGFTAGARFILIKRTDGPGGDWYVWDTARGIVAGNDPHLSLNTTAAEVTSNDTIDTDSTGFVVNQVAATNVNVNAATYIFLAIA